MLAMLTRHLPYRLRNRIDMGRHDRAIRSILDTPPIHPSDDGVVLFSMIGTAVVLPYLVAVKSLWRQLQRGRVVLLDDGTLTPSDKAVLARHCGDPEIIPIGSIETGEFPQGGCWERFLTILDRRQGEYWIQLDSDTVTLGPVPEVMQAIAMNRSFTMLGGEDGSIGALPLAEFAERLYPAGPESGHIQARIESRMGEMRQDTDWRYIRGCAGFTGFAAGGTGRPLAAAFLAEMTRLVGEREAVTWGTEQIASNFHIANEPAPILLPADRYLNYWGEPWSGDACFVHFVGTHRYDNNAYAEESGKAIATLQAPATNIAA
ncbi:hypothetical protein MB02_01920 [Croceicoccus estronivorus]|uniref:hypothetical protein n=1 Tax=Croceicoccus estronivorus TaxID=1172626 RepID=UPI00082D0241|nr:hypothetical protein [Croceicoccus estronivorus]OCC25431.1 hypothetical protein MB02_01920 [Croceicoccus estronivorus]